MESHLSSRDPVIEKRMQAWRETLEFIAKYESAMKWHKEYHAPMLLQMVTCIQSMVEGLSMSEARAQGRLAAMTDFTRTSGHGFGKALRSIELFNGISETDRRVDVRTTNVYPLHERLPRSNRVFRDLDFRLERRDEAKARGTRGMVDAEREALLIDSTMTNEQIVAYTIEYMARSFAQAINPALRFELVKGDKQLGIKAVLDDLNFLPMAA